jgi:large conductance mechanosensitive channel
MKGFIDFIRRGNLVALATAFVMGAAFAVLVASFTTNFVSPLLGLLGTGNLDDQYWCIKSEAGFPNCAIDPDTGLRTGVFIGYGAFLTALISFVLTALVIYFFIVRPYTALEERLKRSHDEATAPTEIDLLTDIRDSLAGVVPARPATAGADIDKPAPPAGP